MDEVIVTVVSFVYEEDPYLPVTFNICCIYTVPISPQHTHARARLQLRKQVSCLASSSVASGFSARSNKEDE